MSITRSPKNVTHLINVGISEISEGISQLKSNGDMSKLYCIVLRCKDYL